MRPSLLVWPVASALLLGQLGCVRAQQEERLEGVLRANLKVFRSTIEVYREDQGSCPSTLMELVERGYLRRIPVDPFTKSDTTWRAVSGECTGHQGVIDVRSGSNALAADGTSVSDW